VSAPVALGSWRCPSGNGCDVMLRELADDVYQVSCAWDDYPLSERDARHYLETIAPAIQQRVAEYTERAGRTLTVLGL